MYEQGQFVWIVIVYVDGGGGGKNKQNEMRANTAQRTNPCVCVFILKYLYQRYSEQHTEYTWLDGARQNSEEGHHTAGDVGGFARFDAMALLVILFLLLL